MSPSNGWYFYICPVCGAPMAAPWVSMSHASWHCPEPGCTTGIDDWYPPKNAQKVHIDRGNKALLGDWVINKETNGNVSCRRRTNGPKQGT